MAFTSPESFNILLGTSGAARTKRRESSSQPYLTVKGLFTYTLYQSVPSQIWFFESLDVNSAAPSQDAIHSMSNLEAKDYYIRSCHEDGIYLFLDHGRVKLQGSAPISKVILFAQVVRRRLISLMLIVYFGLPTQQLGWFYAFHNEKQ